MILCQRIMGIVVCIAFLSSCGGQTKQSEMKSSKTEDNALLCDPELGACEVNTTTQTDSLTIETEVDNNKIQII
jgi:hypothetical protein